MEIQWKIASMLYLIEITHTVVQRILQDKYITTTHQNYIFLELHI